MESVLTIAGSDSGGGAGIQADLKTFTGLKVFGLSVITAVTAQNTRGVNGVYDVPVDGVRKQIETVFLDFEIRALKTGMLFSREIIEVVVEELKKHAKNDGSGKDNIVVDPVLVSTSGDLLLKDDSIKVLRDKLMPLSFLITPNIPEAKELAEVEIDSFDRMEKAGEILIDSGAANVLLKGGHMEKEKESEKSAYDLLVTKDKKKIWFEDKRLALGPLHGTGCTLSAAICALIARGYQLEEAVSNAKKYTHRAIAKGFRPGAGSRVLDFYSFYDS